MLHNFFTFFFFYLCRISGLCDICVASPSPSQPKYTSCLKLPVHTNLFIIVLNIILNTIFFLIILNLLLHSNATSVCMRATEKSSNDMCTQKQSSILLTESCQHVKSTLSLSNTKGSSINLLVTDIRNWILLFLDLNQEAVKSHLHIWVILS